MSDAVDEAEDVAKEVTLPSLATRIDWVDDSEEALLEANKAARQDRDYYDNHQIDAETMAKLKKRHQPIIVKNRIARKINFILGEEDRKRINPVALPRNPDDVDSARAATDGLREAADEEKFDKVRAAVFKSCIVEGIGGALKGMEQCDDGSWKHTLQHIEFDRLCYDHHSRAVDFADARWVGLIMWMDLDDAIERWPDAEDDLRAAVSHGVATSSQTEDAPRRWTSNTRKRLKVCEMYARTGDDWYRYVFTQGADIEKPSKSWIVDDKGKSYCPLVMLSCYIDAENRRYGIVRALISPQDVTNKFMSKAMHLLAVNGAIGEDGAVDDPDKFLAELAKPDGFATVNPGSLVDGRIQLREPAQLAAGQMQLLQEAKQDIDTIGPSAATIPELPNSASGVAFSRRQQAAAQELGAVFRQLHDWSMQVFTLDWICIRNYWTDEKWLRVTDDQEITGYRFTSLNQRMTRAQRMQSLLEKDQALNPRKALEVAAGNFAPIILRDVEYRRQMMAQQIQGAMQQAQQQGMQPPPQLMQMAQQMDDPQALVQAIMSHPAMQEEVGVNQVSEMTVDIILDEAPDTAVMAQEEFATLAELLPTIAQARPDIAPKILTLMVKASSLPDKRELMKILEEQPDPQAAQMQQQMHQLGMAAQQAQVAVAQSQAQLNAARAQGEQAKSQVSASGAQVEQAKAPSEIKLNEARALQAATSAGAQSVTASAPQEMPNAQR